MFERLASEQHDTLDGVPEPAENPRLVGHGDVAGMLAAAYRAGKLPHALLFAGPAGIGKATLAYHLAYHLLKYPERQAAPEQLVAPDPHTSLFRQIATGAHPSVLHLTRPANDKTKSFKTVLTVDEIRKVNRFLSMTSHDGGYRVVIVDPADDMNTNAANALLKNLEEPPARTVFVLIAHSLGSLLPTIRSRCQTIRFSPLGPGDLLEALRDVEPPLPADPQARAALAERAGGSPRTAILLTQYGGLEIAQALDRLLRSPKPAINDKYKLAEAVAAKDQQIAFDMFNERVLETIATAATDAASAGQGARADRLSQEWQEVRLAIEEADTYNLDRKQHALIMISRLIAALRM